MRRPLAAIVLTAALAGCGSSTSTTATVHRPSGQLVGVMFDGPVLSPRVNLDQQLDQAVRAGVESLRVAVDWSKVQPRPSAPDLSSLDTLVGKAAQRHLTLLPVVEYTPGWAAKTPGNPASPPKDPSSYAKFITALVERYGSHGSFWTEHPSTPRVPIEMWQIWNEPHFTSYWSEQPFAPSYVRLLRAAHEAIRAADPNAKTVLAGLADFSWQYLAQIYNVPGASRLFDVVAIHPYTAHPQGVITILERVRQVMDHNGDRAKPILATEITWPSSEGKAPPEFGVSTTEAQQAQRLAQVVPLLDRSRRALGLMGFYWYTWMGDESPGKHQYAFDYAGLERYQSGAIEAKPALSVFRANALATEGCRAKTAAFSCAS